MEKRIRNIIIGCSIAVPVIVGILIYQPVAEDVAGAWTRTLPHINAAINATTSLLLLIGWYFIKRKQISNHRITMLSAFFLGCVFLVSYIIYHSSVPSTSFGGEGVIRLVYYSLLISHIILAVAVVPFVLMALYFALNNKIDNHKKIVKIAYPLWLYVSISGVLVYYLIRPYYG